MEVYKKLLKEYTDKVIDNYEDWFAKDVLVDISENGGLFDSLINEQYEFYFNVDLSRSLQNIIENLLDDEYNEKDQKKKDEHYELVIEFIKLKRITDKRILESKAYDENWISEWLFGIKEESAKIFQKEDFEKVSLNKNLLNNEDLINQIGTFLVENGYINSKKSLFNELFINNSEQKIIWVKGLRELAVFVFSLYDKKIILNKNLPLLAVTLFETEQSTIKLGSARRFFTDAKDKDLYYAPEIRDFFDKLEVKFS